MSHQRLEQLCTVALLFSLSQDQLEFLQGMKPYQPIEIIEPLDDLQLRLNNISNVENRQLKRHTAKLFFGKGRAELNDQALYYPATLFKYFYKHSPQILEKNLDEVNYEQSFFIPLIINNLTFIREVAKCKTQVNLLNQSLAEDSPFFKDSTHDTSKSDIWSEMHSLGENHLQFHNKLPIRFFVMALSLE